MDRRHSKGEKERWSKWKFCFILFFLNAVVVMSILTVYFLCKPEKNCEYPYLFEPAKVERWFCNNILNSPKARERLNFYRRLVKESEDIKQLIKIARIGDGSKPYSDAVLAILALAEGKYQNAIAIGKFLEDEDENKVMAANWALLRLKERLLTIISDYRPISLDTVEDLLTLVVSSPLPLFYEGIDVIEILAFVFLISNWKDHIVLSLLMKGGSEIEYTGFRPWRLPFFDPMPDYYLAWFVMKDNYPEQFLPSGINEHQVLLSFVKEIRNQRALKNPNELPVQLYNRINNILRKVEREAKQALGKEKVQ